MKTIRHLTVAVLLLAQAACAVQQTVSLAPQDAAQQVREGQAFSLGDRVVIALRDGHRYSGTFVEFTPTELVTQRARYKLVDVSSISYEKTDKTAMALNTVGAVTAALVVLGVGAMILLGRALSKGFEERASGSGN